MNKTTEPRPSKRCEEVFHAVAKELADELREHGNCCEEDIYSVLQQSGDYDGYSIAKMLERLHLWDCNAEIVAILDNADVYQSCAHNAIVKKWVTENGIVPELRIGDKCKYRNGRNESTGEIVVINETIAKYTVFDESLGHVRTGNGTHGFILPYEQVERLEP